ncbi:MAG: hypothetical protein JWP17_2515 [Solirubrobacterales bacterium]|jgi:hypothetical protein|nr:hypothetical protein [Solirubrobacterales bacterium]
MTTHSVLWGCDDDALPRRRAITFAVWFLWIVGGER